MLRHSPTRLVLLLLFLQASASGVLSLGEDLQAENPKVVSSTTIQKATKPPEKAQREEASKAQIEVTGSRGEPAFSELTLFLFGSGLALFVALLGWSDQIRGINESTREVEEKFLEQTKLDKGNFLLVVKTGTPEEQLQALTSLIGSGRIKSATPITLLRIFKQWNEQWTQLECLSQWKYNLTVLLTVCMFSAGVVSLFVPAGNRVHLHFVSMRMELLILLAPFLVVATIITIIVLTDIKANHLRALLNSISDMV